MARACRDAAGGIRGLIEFLTEHGEAVNFDLRAHCGISLSDVVARRVTLRELGSLLRHMPADGTAQWRHARRNPSPDVKAAEPPADWWVPERDLLAGISDGLSVLIWLHTEDARQGRNRPKPITRPGVKAAEKPRRLPAGQAMALLARIGPASVDGPRPEEGTETDRAESA